MLLRFLGTPRQITWCRWYFENRYIEKLKQDFAHYRNLGQANERRNKELEGLLGEERASLATLLVDKAPIKRPHETHPDFSIIILPIHLPVLTQVVDRVLAKSFWEDIQRIYEEHLKTLYYEEHLKTLYYEDAGECVERDEDTAVHGEYVGDEDEYVEDFIEDELAEVLQEQSSGGSQPHGGYRAPYARGANHLTGFEGDGWRSKKGAEKGAEKFCRQVKNGYNSQR